MEYKPPFSINDDIINLLAKTSELVGQVSILHKSSSLKLRRENRIKTIHSSLAIEHNSLSLEQVTAVINGKRILGAPQEIKEVQNAYEAYDIMLTLNPLSIEDLLKAHKLMMNDLVKENGRFRNGGVGIFDGNKLIHTAPPANYVPQLISDLFEWYKQSPLHILIKSCIFHYEFEFIHPFADGNGRIGRMWHTLLLSQWNKLFSWLPIEELIKEKIREEKMENHVILLGKKQNPYPYIKACDIYVQPSRYEGKSVAVREAQLIKKPVIITNYSTAKSQLENEIDGLIVPMENKDCADQMVEIIQDVEKLRKISEACSKRDYSNKREVQKLYKLFE